MANALPLVAGVILVAIGLVGVGIGRRRRHEFETIAGTQTTEVLSITPGPVEVSGTASPVDDRLLRAPFSEAECLLAEWEIEEWEESGKHSGWETKGSGVETVPFLLDDGTGTVLVRPSGADVDLDETGTETVEVGATERSPVPIREFLELDATPGPSAEPLIEALDWGTTHGDRKYHQRLVTPGDEVYVYGTATREPGDEWGERDFVIAERTGDGETTGASRTRSDSTDERHGDAALFLVSDHSEEELVEDRSDYRLYVAGGTFATLLGAGILAAQVLGV